jgi:hypothetical protein
MAISEKTRKILWGRSGNRCALCRRELIINATDLDDESVIGDECHLVSGKVKGPRHNPTFPLEHIDEPENLILLCRVHHKMVDDQRETYTVEMLQKLKSDHEGWVSARLAEQDALPPVRIRRIKENIPSYLPRLLSGKVFASIISESHAYVFEHDELTSEVDVELIANFSQEVYDWGDVWPVMEAADRVRAAYRLSTLLCELEEAGFWVFVGQECQRLEGGVDVPTPFMVAILYVSHKTNPGIIKLKEGAAVKKER